MEKRLPHVSVAIFIVALLVVSGPKTEAQVKSTVTIKTLTWEWFTRAH
jgi:hypothetical protein